MDSQKSPPSSPAQHHPSPPPADPSVPPMAAVVAQQPFAPPPGDARSNPNASSGVGKTRYRPAPAKTFQCRGYGECRMVFSRSEHLARHIRYVSPPCQTSRPPLPDAICPSSSPPTRPLET